MADYNEETWPKTCSCGQVYSEEDWEHLEYIGVQKTSPMMGIPDFELRNCARCNSSMAIAVPNDFVRK